MSDLPDFAQNAVSQETQSRLDQRPQLDTSRLSSEKLLSVATYVVEIAAIIVGLMVTLRWLTH